jgi:hypothetical protein
VPALSQILVLLSTSVFIVTNIGTSLCQCFPCHKYWYFFLQVFSLSQILVLLSASVFLVTNIGTSLCQCFPCHKSWYFSLAVFFLVTNIGTSFCQCFPCHILICLKFDWIETESFNQYKFSVMSSTTELSGLHCYFPRYIPKALLEIYTVIQMNASHWDR